MTNNEIIKNLRVALSLRWQDIHALIKLGGLDISNSYLQGLAVSMRHRHYRSCSDEVLEAFVRGLVLHYRDRRKNNGS
jgi:uncharacterized protein YehS (DUF1456 family)